MVTTYAYTTGVGYYETVATRGSQAKTTYTDSLGRVTETITPDAGTWNYYYDSVSTPGCPSGYTGVVGRLEASKDPNGNLICYKYDALNRVTGINANGTTCRHFYYDTSYGTVPSGVTTPTNTLGRLAEASTDNCSGTLITDEWFSYDKDGNKTDLWETTPNAGRYFHSVATFAGNNAVLTTHLEVPSLITTTYTLDGEGRWNGASNNNGSGVTIVPSSPGVTYNAASQPTNIPLGSSTDYDSYTYDANTGRMKTWVFQVGTGSSNQENATLTWNPIGSLESLAITDDFNSSGTQTCTFGASGSQGYDDLGRLLYDSCVSGSAIIWGQTFSYDIYNNLTKTRLSGATNGTTFHPTYNTISGCSPCNNQYQFGYGASYDSNGNQLYDPSNMNTYSWNEFSKMASIDKTGTNCSTSGTCVTYDAFGRDVEIDSGTTYTEIFYTQVGKGLQHGSTEVYSYWGLPGGGTQVYSGNTGYLHKDWLGSARLMSNITAQTITYDQALSPYGEQYAASGNVGGEAMFTGDTQNISSGTSGLWDTPNRELGSAPSRWLSPDPIGAGWNPYAYATNPNTFIDPSGLKYCIGVAAPGCAVPGGGSEDGEGLAGSDPLDGDMNEMSTLGPGGEDYDASGGGTVGTDGGPAAVSDATNAYFDSLGSQGSLTSPEGAPEPYSTPDPDISAILGTFQPVQPLLAGCQGPGTPCHAIYSHSPRRRTGEVNYMGRGPEAGIADVYLFTVVDENWVPVWAVSSVTELYQDADSPESAWLTESTWTTSSTLFLGSFPDSLGATIGSMGSSFTYNQMFIAQMGGIPYSLTTEILQFMVYPGGSNLYTSVSVKVP
jgi:RHS repeat-associated protein